MSEVLLKNNGEIPLAIPGQEAIPPGATMPIRQEVFERYKNNPSVKNWLSSGRLERVEEVLPAEEPSVKEPAEETENQDVLTDEQIQKLLGKSIDDATCAFKGVTDIESLNRAVAAEKAGENRKGMLKELAEIIEGLTDGDADR